MAFRHRSLDPVFDHNWSHRRDDEFGPEDTFGPDAVAEDPAVFTRAIRHPVKSLRPDGPGDEAFLHDEEIDHKGNIP